jgi:DNA polymerase-3 subunit gamma/tau
LKKFKQKKQELIEASKLQAGKKLPVEPFTQTAFEVQWYKYLEILRKQHEKNMHSILTIDKKPRVEGNNIHIILSSNALKTELERNKEKVLNYLRRHLNNYEIDFVIEVKEEIQKELVYTKNDKFNKLMEKYPDLIIFKEKFKLNL